MTDMARKTNTKAHDFKTGEVLHRDDQQSLFGIWLLVQRRCCIMFAAVSSFVSAHYAQYITHSLKMKKNSSDLYQWTTI